MNILLLYPEIPRSIIQFPDMVKVVGKKSAFPPLGLLTVAALLSESWDKKLIDLNTGSLNKNDIEWAEYAFISAMNVQSESVRDLIKLLNKYNLKIVAGGPLFTHEYLEYEGVDHFVLNEAEITLPLFLEDLEKGTPKKIYQSNEFADIHKTPIAKWELANLEDYLYSVVQYSRGCPYLCDFCDVTALFGRRPRTKTPEQIINELDKLISLGKVEQVLFADDNLIGNKNLLKKELLPALIKWREENPFAPGFATQVTINLADDKELAEMMLEAGFRNILIGIESVDEDSLIAMKKKQNTRRNLLKDIQYLHDLGFIIMGTFIVGLDTDKPTVFDDVIKFIQESGIVLSIINILKAPPGTELYDRMKREGRLLSTFKFGEDATNVIPLMGLDELEKGYKKIIDTIYSSESVFKRVRKYFEFNRTYKVKYPLKRKLTFLDFLKSLKIIFILGVVDKNRKYFWKIIKLVLKKNYNYLDLALLFSLILYQYSVLREENILVMKKAVAA
ncbi:MAG: B12-binding domain-containing radical SAM protein [Melioribacteraceae bacterium]|nr:B12-binding domain-containing radical SAM protein [Melioribacteraceae bacterium]